MASLAPAEEFTTELVSIGALPGELAYPDSPALGSVVIAGPHPLLGGTMGNNVVRALGDGLAARGRVTLRFDYRDGGRDAARLAAFWKTSRAPEEPEWANELIAAVDFLRGIAPNLPVTLIGYSFGCTLLPAAIRGGEPLILIAPTVGQHNFSDYEALLNPKLIIAPVDDFAADAAEMARWLEQLSEPKWVEQPRRDGHFFRGHEAWLVETVVTFLDSCGGRP